MVQVVAGQAEITRLEAIIQGRGPQARLMDALECYSLFKLFRGGAISVES